MHSFYNAYTVVERSLMVQWIVGSIPYCEPIEYFSLQSMLHEWITKGLGMCYPVCAMVYIKATLLLIGMSSQCSGGSGFSLSLFKWSLPYTSRPITP